MSVHVFMTHISLMTGRTWIDRQTDGAIDNRQLAGRLSISKMKYCFNTFFFLTSSILINVLFLGFFFFFFFWLYVFLVCVCVYVFCFCFLAMLLCL